MTHGLLVILSAAGPSRVALSLNKVIVDPVKVLLRTSGSLLPTAKWTERKYFMPAKWCEFLFSHPLSLSLLRVATTSEKDCERQAGLTRKAKDPKKRDLLGGKPT